MNQNSNDEKSTNGFYEALAKFASALEWCDKNITTKMVKTASVIADVFSRIDFDKIQKWAHIFSNLSYMNLLSIILTVSKE